MVQLALQSYKVPPEDRKTLAIAMLAKSQILPMLLISKGKVDMLWTLENLNFQKISL